MHALLALTRANIRSYTRDRAAVFWTLAFPLVFIVLFGLIFQGSGTARLTLGWVDEDNSAAAVKLRAGFAALDGVTLVDDDAPGRAGRMQVGKVDGDHRRAGRLRRGARGKPGGRRPADPDRDLHRPVAAAAPGFDLPGGRHGPRDRQPGRPAAARRPEPADGPDREPQRDQLLRPEHARAVDHAGRDLRRDPARRRPREAHPQAPRRDAAAALAAGRLERPDAGAHRVHPGDHHRRRRLARCSGSRSSAA